MDIKLADGASAYDFIRRTLVRFGHHGAGRAVKAYIGKATGLSRALAEGKNGSVVRKRLGHGHIPKAFAADVDAFTQGVLSPFLNFHRPCLFPTEVEDDKGRVRRRYKDDDMATPYERLHVRGSYRWR